MAKRYHRRGNGQLLTTVVIGMLAFGAITLAVSQVMRYSPPRIEVVSGACR